MDIFAALDALPRHPLVGGPTALERLARLGAALGHPQLFVKRDDAMALGMGGNKLRSLEFWLGEAMARGADVVVVAGRLASNQCRLTAAAAARLGLPCVILYADPPPARLGGNALLSHLLGAEIRYLGPLDEAARARAAEEVVETLARAGRRPWLIGEPVTGALGYVRAAREFLAQAGELGTDFAHVVVPGSMGPTEAGLVFGLLAAGFRGRVHIVCVEYDAAETAARVEAIFAGLARRLGEPGAGPWAIARCDDRFLGEGYDVLTDAAAAAIRRLARTEALLLEPTYTAKPFAALLAMVEEGEIGADEPACIWHTGGLPTLFDDPRVAALAAP